MATVDKDFKVKNGLVVTNGGTFGGTVTVATPTLDGHAATKEYVDSLTGGMYVGPTPPASPQNGLQWLNTANNRVQFYYEGTWYIQAILEDTQGLIQHIHDTAIDGTGFITTVFQDGGYYYASAAVLQDSGYYNATSWTTLFDGGSPTDPFN